MDTEKTVDLGTYLEDEVSNGGFHQLFHNSSGDHTAEMICALETIEAFAMAEIVRRAAGKFPGGTPPKERPNARRLCGKTSLPRMNLTSLMRNSLRTRTTCRSCSKAIRRIRPFPRVAANGAAPPDEIYH